MGKEQEILSLLKQAIDSETKEIRIYKNDKSRDISNLINLFSKFENLSSIGIQKLTDSIGLTLSKLFDEEKYKYYIRNLTDIVVNYETFNSPWFVEEYSPFIDELLEELKKAKENNDIEAEKNNDIALIRDSHKELIRKINSKEILNGDDIELLSKLFIGKSYQEVLKLFDIILEYNSSLNITKKKSSETTKINKYDINIVKELFDSMFVDKLGNSIADKDGNTVFDRLPEDYKVKMARAYQKNSSEFVDLLNIIFNNNNFEFLRTYGTSFNDETTLAYEQRELCKFLKNASYDLLNNYLAKDCKQYGYTMQELLENIAGVYKRETNKNGETPGVGGQRNVDELHVSGSYETYANNIAFLANINELLPNLIMKHNPKALLTPHERFKNNINIIKKYWIDDYIAIITNNPIILTSTDLYNNIEICKEYGIPIIKGDDILSALVASDLKNRINTLLEAGMYKYMIDNPGRLCRTAEFMKRFYYGNSSRDNGFEEIQNIDSALSKLGIDELEKTDSDFRKIGFENAGNKVMITDKGVKGTFDGYVPPIATKHYGDIENFTEPELLKRYRKKVPNDLFLFLEENYGKHIPEACKDLILNIKEVKELEKKYRIDDFTYNIDGVIISRNKFLDVMYLCAIYHNKNDKKLESSKVTEDEKLKVEENLKFIKNKHMLLVNALTYNSNCSHFALIKLVKAVVDITEYSIEEEQYDDFKQAMKK